jgi:hypothetical protein
MVGEKARKVNRYELLVKGSGRTQEGQSLWCRIAQNKKKRIGEVLRPLKSLIAGKRAQRFGDSLPN